MTKQMVLHDHKLTVNKRQPLLEPNTTPPPPRRRGNHARKESLAEVAGGTTADCAAVCCCCPCGLVNLIVLAVYKLPAGLCRKALRKKRRHRLMKKGLLPPRRCNCDEKEMQIHPVMVVNPALEGGDVMSDDVEVVELDKEMWDQFYGTGFWRSASQRSETSAL